MAWNTIQVDLLAEDTRFLFEESTYKSLEHDQVQSPRIVDFVVSDDCDRTSSSFQQAMNSLSDLGFTQCQAGRSHVEFKTDDISVVIYERDGVLSHLSLKFKLTSRPPALREWAGLATVLCETHNLALFDPQNECLLSCHEFVELVTRSVKWHELSQGYGWGDMPT